MMRDLNVFTAVKVHVEFFWVVTPCSVVVGYRCLGGPCCLRLHSASQPSRHRLKL